METEGDIAATPGSSTTNIGNECTIKEHTVKINTTEENTPGDYIGTSDNENSEDFNGNSSDDEHNEVGIVWRILSYLASNDKEDEVAWSDDDETLRIKPQSMVRMLQLVGKCFVKNSIKRGINISDEDLIQHLLDSLKDNRSSNDDKSSSENETECSSQSSDSTNDLEDSSKIMKVSEHEGVFQFTGSLKTLEDSLQKMQINDQSESQASISLKFKSEAEMLQLYRKCISDCEENIRIGEIDKIKLVITTAHGINNFQYKEEIFHKAIHFACSFNQPDILDYLLKEYESDEDNTEMKQSAFYQALSTSNVIFTKSPNVFQMFWNSSRRVKLLDILYDHWSGDLHWVGGKTWKKGHTITNLEKLSNILVYARTKYEEKSDHDKEMLFYMDSLIKFNSFQSEMYLKLIIDGVCRKKFKRCLGTKNFNTIKKEADAIKRTISTVLCVYMEYLNNFEMYALQVETTSGNEFPVIHLNALANLILDFYMRKIDFNVSLIILDNLLKLKQLIPIPGELYEELESKLYFFIYHLSNDWETFSLKTTPQQCTVKLGGDFFHNAVLNIPLDKFDRCAHIYLERKDFHNFLEEFLQLLVNVNVKDSVKEKNTSGTVEISKAFTLPYVKDDFSLKKILYCMEGLPSKGLLKIEKKVAQLTITRILQVLGEFIKSFTTSDHLSITTKALIQIEIPSQTIDYLQSIRNLLSHVKKGELSERIRIEDEHHDVYERVLDDLEEIKRIIGQVAENHKPRVEMVLLKKAMELLRGRLREIAENTENKNEQGKFSEVSYLKRNTDLLATKLRLSLAEVENNMIIKYPQFIQKIRNTLKIFETFEPNDAEKHWEFIRGLLIYMVDDAELFKDHPNEIAMGQCTSIYKDNLEKTSGEITKEILLILVEQIEEEMLRTRRLLPPAKLPQMYNFQGIVDIHNLLNVKRILSKEEQETVKSFFADEITHSSTEIMNKVENNQFLNQQEFAELSEELAWTENTKSILQKLIVKYNRDPKLLECLANRVSLLKEILNRKALEKSNLVTQLMNDRQFCMSVEVLLFDIMNIFNESNLDVEKQMNFLAGISLRNVLSHGNPLLEVIGGVLHPKDLPTELISRSLSLIEDEPSIRALLELIQQGVEPSKIRNKDKGSLNREQKEKLRIFNKSKRRSYYLKLIKEDPEPGSSEAQAGVNNRHIRKQRKIEKKEISRAAKVMQHNVVDESVDEDIGLGNMFI